MWDDGFVPSLIAKHMPRRSTQMQAVIARKQVIRYFFTDPRMENLTPQSGNR
ncbi:MAG: hypothetical protein H6Q32_881 [Bacteroidetes bacterium]|nr:hypothetical protein [Bacteroidota bacterium]